MPGARTHGPVSAGGDTGDQAGGRSAVPGGSGETRGTRLGPDPLGSQSSDREMDSDTRSARC